VLVANRKEIPPAKAPSLFNHQIQHYSEERIRSFKKKGRGGGKPDSTFLDGNIAFRVPALFTNYFLGSFLLFVMLFVMVIIRGVMVGYTESTVQNVPRFWGQWSI